MLGASGAVMAVVVLYTLYYPNRQVLLFFVISSPEGAADVVRSILAIIGDALSSIAQFFRSLF